MSDIHDVIEIDCQPTPRPRLPKPVTKPAAPPARQAPVALNQKPPPPPDRWDACDVRPVEFGSAAELREQLIARLEEALAQARGDWEPTRWDVRSATWPYTRIGLLLMRCISIADTIADQIHKAETTPVYSGTKEPKSR